MRWDFYHCHNVTFVHSALLKVQYGGIYALSFKPMILAMTAVLSKSWLLTRSKAEMYLWTAASKVIQSVNLSTTNLSEFSHICVIYVCFDISLQEVNLGFKPVTVFLRQNRALRHLPELELILDTSSLR